jgi:hypothetical protein
MKRFILLYFLAVNAVFGQVNLIPNGSFENIISCPREERWNIAMARPWRSAYDSPFLFCGCGNTNTAIPLGYFDALKIVPASGQNYAGYHIYYSKISGRPDDNHPQTDVLGVRLCDSLKVGVRYYASFKLAMATTGKGGFRPFSHHGMKLSTKNLAYGPRVAASPTNNIISNFAHVYSSKPVDDSLQWTTIKGTFIADSNYKYAYVGLMFQGSIASAHLPAELISRGAFYYVDDVCLSTDSASYKKMPPALCAPVADKISMRQVYDNDFCRNTLYTWTSEQQTNELRNTKKLLVKSKSNKGEYSVFDISLRDTSLKNNDLVNILLEERFAKKRYAWSNSFATVMGWKEENYGNHLLKIVLHDSAIIGRFKRIYMGPREDLLSFYDLKGRKLSVDYVTKHKNRIAAIYHMNTYQGSLEQYKRKQIHRTSFVYTNKHSKRTTYVYFREFVIVNEEMIKDWSYGTEEIKEELRCEIDLLKNLKPLQGATQYAYHHSEWDWRLADENYIPDVSADLNKDNSQQIVDTLNPITFGMYLNLLCFRNDYYLFNPKAIQRIINKLELALKVQSSEFRK